MSPVIPQRFREDYDPEPDDRPSPSDFADDTPARPPCGGPCRPEGCHSRRCWQDYPPGEDE